GKDAGFSYLTSTNTFLALEEVARRLGVASGAAHTVPDDLDVRAHRILDNFARNRDIVKALGAAYQFKYVFLIEPFLATGEKPPSAAEAALLRSEGGTRLTASRKAVYALFQTFHDPDFQYLGDAFKNHPEDLYIDLAHLNARATDLMADRIYQAL